MYLKQLKLPGVDVVLSGYLDNYAITNARSKSYSKLNPKANIISYTLSIVLPNQAKCDEVLAALEKATGIKGEVGDLREAMDFEDVASYTIYYYIAPNEQSLSSYK